MVQFTEPKPLIELSEESLERLSGVMDEIKRDAERERADSGAVSPWVGYWRED